MDHYHSVLPWTESDSDDSNFDAIVSDFGSIEVFDSEGGHRWSEPESEHAWSSDASDSEDEVSEPEFEPGTRGVNASEAEEEPPTDRERTLAFHNNLYRTSHNLYRTSLLRQCMAAWRRTARARRRLAYLLNA